MFQWIILDIQKQKNEKKKHDPCFMHSILIKKRGKEGVSNQNDVHEPWVVLFFLVFLLLYVLYDLLEHIYNVFSLGQCHFHNMKQPPLILHRGLQMITGYRAMFTKNDFCSKKVIKVLDMLMLTLSVLVGTSK